MKKCGVPALICAPLLLGGCASTMTAIFERSVSTEHLGGAPPEAPYDVLTMTGERRIAVVGPINTTIKVCAESLPDAARAAAATSNIALQTQDPMSGQRAINVNDAVATALLQTFARTETADVVRQLGWQLCQAYLNGAISYQSYDTHLGSIIKGSFDVMERRTQVSTGSTSALPFPTIIVPPVTVITPSPAPAAVSSPAKSPGVSSTPPTSVPATPTAGN